MRRRLHGLSSQLDRRLGQGRRLALLLPALLLPGSQPLLRRQLQRPLAREGERVERRTYPRRTSPTLGGWQSGLAHSRGSSGAPAPDSQCRSPPPRHPPPTDLLLGPQSTRAVRTGGPPAAAPPAAALRRPVAAPRGERQRRAAREGHRRERGGGGGVPGVRRACEQAAAHHRGGEAAEGQLSPLVCRARRREATRRGRACGGRRRACGDMSRTCLAQVVELSWTGRAGGGRRRAEVRSRRGAACRSRRAGLSSLRPVPWRQTAAAARGSSRRLGGSRRPRQST